MFDFFDNKTFMDPIHGYISIPRTFVQHIIDTEYFQRLRNVNQTGMNVLYPNGKHDRYSHSLGVYHLGLKAVDALLKNFSENRYWNIKSNDRCEIFWAKNKVLFLIACLLHDIGHAPFSHSLENEVLDNSNNKLILSRLIDKLNKVEPDENVRIWDIKSAPHEIIGSLLVFDKLKPLIKLLLDDLRSLDYPNIKREFLYEYAKIPPTINSDDIDNDVCFIARMILGLKYKGFQPEKQIKNCFIELLNGKNFDVDKLDYIIRDTKMSGISNISIDVDRLLNALTLVISTKYAEYEFTDYDLRNCFVKDFLFSDDDWCEINGHFYGTVVLSEGAEACIIGGAENITLEPVSNQFGEAQIESKIIIDEYVDLKEVKEAYIGDKAIEYDKRRKVYPLMKGGEGRYVLRNIQICDDCLLKFTVSSNQYNLIIGGDCCFKIKGKAKISSVKIDGKVSGKCKKMIILGEHLGKDNMIPKDNAHNVFSVGFKKQAINLLSNVLEARDYLYLWIYAHHKVIYYANFLVPCLAELITEHVNEDKFPNWNLNYNDIDVIDDAYINTVLKYMYKEKKEELTDNQIALLCEYFSRNYKKSVYKSLAEYDLFFSEFDMQQKNEIKGYLDEICSQEDKENRGNLNYGIVPNEYIEKINSYSEEAKLKSLIWVSASYSHKILNKVETYCVFPNDEVVTMEYLNLFKSQDHFSNSNTNHYFYLYYEAEKGDGDKIKEVLIKYFKSIKNKEMIAKV